MIQATLPRQAAQPLDLNKLAGQVLQPWADAYDTWRSGLDSWRSGVDQLVKPAAKPHCGCPVCAPDPCACRCCVTDADLVIEARVGERRVVPVIVENPWRRERDVEVELSGWTSVSDTVEVKGEIFGQAAFKLAPCGREEVVLLLTVAGQAATTPGKTLPPDKPAPKGRQNLPIQERQLPDVDRCLVAYADLRIKGCDLRSVRVAVAILPRDCEAFTVDCGCACCC